MDYTKPIKIVTMKTEDLVIKVLFSKEKKSCISETLVTYIFTTYFKLIALYMLYIKLKSF